jgi:hypothetical protein
MKSLVSYEDVKAVPFGAKIAYGNDADHLRLETVFEDELFSNRQRVGGSSLKFVYEHFKYMYLVE